MPFLEISFAVIWIILFSLTVNRMKITRAEMAFLPQLSKKVDFKSLPDVNTGKSVVEILPEELITDSYMVLAVTSPSCSFCHSGVEEFLKLNEDTQLPFLNLLVIEDETNEDVVKFLQLYKGVFQTITVTNDTIRYLLIDGFPTFLLINSEGKIVHESGWSKGILMTYKKLNEQFK